ncbi:hypothetical protein [Nocardioides sp. GY 10113]|uniref:hypothetical protein n=1 Tax=Nocardioides sp. GY 10113 TaxID=2569761 RepID=UPI0014583373|nr:hypothetical protein [Nocardioides sp. GY 10113]
MTAAAGSDLATAWWQAASPTASTLAWRTLLAIGAVVVAVVALAELGADRPTTVPLTGASVLASAVLASLHDPARELLAPLPVGPGRRRALRIALAAAATAPFLVAVESIATTADPVWPTVLALVGAGWAAATWLPGRLGIAAAVLLPPTTLWAATTLGWSAGEVALRHPWIVLAVGLGAVAAGRDR